MGRIRLYTLMPGTRRLRKRVSWRDQLPDGMSLTLPGDFTDPAILAARPSNFRYTREELLGLQKVPLAQKRPEYLDTAYNNSNGIWDPELWHRSRFDGTNENGGEIVYKRRSGDPRDRIRKEDGIVLSPQRRSFNSGCFVPLKENQRPNRTHSPTKTDPNLNQYREGGRRIGSGRILSRDVPWDFQNKEPDDFTYRKERRGGEDDGRYERRSYGRDLEKDKRGRFNNDRRRIDSHEEEPEWFSAGPVSQHDTIELRGFDDADKTGKFKKPTKKKKEHKISENRQAGDGCESVAETVADPTNNNNNLGNAEKSSGSDQNAMFNFDDILKSESIAGLLRNNGVENGGGGDAAGSRFSQFFTRNSPVKNDSRRSSFEGDSIVRNILNDITEPNILIPNDSNLYFAPISPAANTGAIQKPVNIMDMIRNKPANRVQDVQAKVVSLAELEARILQQGRNEQSNVHPHKTENDSVAFERLVAQMKGSNTSGGSGLSKMSLPNAYKDENSQVLGPPSPNDIALKIHEFQQQQAHLDLMGKLMSAHRQMPPHDFGQNRELLNRPEAQAILQALHQQRIPSPRELQQHTQVIMQNALLKKKLEEQQDNFKRRNSPLLHHHHNTPSPTPLAFTPTSVLRKMTADKDDGKAGLETSPQGRPVTGMKSANVMQPQQPAWNVSLKQPGRPIVKANVSLQQQQHELQQMYQQRLYGQQSQMRKQFQQPPQTGAPSVPSQSAQFNHVQYPFPSSNPQQFQHQHQLRVQHQQHQPPQQQQSFKGNQPPPPWSQHHLSMLAGHNNYDNRSLHLMGDRGCTASNNGGELSPIANQLARWFPQELLEKARAGKVPSLPNSTLAQHAEEMERHAAPPIHN